MVRQLSKVPLHRRAGVPEQPRRSRCPVYHRIGGSRWWLHNARSRAINGTSNSCCRLVLAANTTSTRDSDGTLSVETSLLAHWTGGFTLMKVRTVSLNLPFHSAHRPP